MKYILIILVFLSVGAKAQMIIKAHANYVPFASANRFLDIYTGASGAYSLRKLRTAYTGAAVRVRKDTTDQPEQDVFFTASGDFDTVSLKNFLNARSGFVVTWYDQSTNGRNATQATQANQPRIANLGVIERIAGEPSIFFDGTNDNLRADGVASDFTGEDKPLTSISVINKTNNNTAGEINSISRISTGTPFLRVILNNNTQYGFLARDDGNNVITRGGGTYAANTNYLYFANTSGTSISLHSNNVTVLNASAYNIGSITLDQFSIGSFRSTSSYFGGYISETIIYPTDRGSDRSGMQTNINSYYNIYWNGDFTGILDTYPNSAAAYSLRNLSSTYTGPLIRVRKDTTGQPEQDIYGDYYGNLDTITLNSFLLTRSGFVTTWYDQSGNGRNASQATQANQPRIANLGVIERQNNKPCLFQTTQFLDWSKTNSTLGQAYCIWRSSDSTNMIPFGSTTDAGTFYGAMSSATTSPTANYGTPLFFKNLDAQLANNRIALRNAYIINNIVLSYVTDVGRIATVRSNYTGGGGFTGTNYIFEFIYYENLTNNRTAISNNINAYYSIW